MSEKLKNSIFEVLTIPQTLNINNQITTSTKPINLDIIRKLIEYFLKNMLVKEMFTLTLFEILLFKERSILSPTQWVQAVKWFKYSVLKKRENEWLFERIKKQWYSIYSDKFFSWYNLRNSFKISVERYLIDERKKTLKFSGKNYRGSKEICILISWKNLP